MNEAGVLGRFIPEFGKIVAMMQFNMYHHYTVDEHLIRTVACCRASTRAGRRARASAGLQADSRHRGASEALYVAVFLHDIAKGRPEDHSDRRREGGAQAVPAARASTNQTELVAWLVANT
jgi:[protein-PII] uridylyltransferase